MLRTIFATKITKNGFVTHRCARFFADFARYAQDFPPKRAGRPQQHCATLTEGHCPITVFTVVIVITVRNNFTDFTAIGIFADIEAMHSA